MAVPYFHVFNLLTCSSYYMTVSASFCCLCFWVYTLTSGGSSSMRAGFLLIVLWQISHLGLPFLLLFGFALPERGLYLNHWLLGKLFEKSQNWFRKVWWGQKPLITNQAGAPVVALRCRDNLVLLIPSFKGCSLPVPLRSFPSDRPWTRRSVYLQTSAKWAV